MPNVIERLVEVEQRRLYLAQATSSLYRYCIDLHRPAPAPTMSRVDTRRAGQTLALRVGQP